MAALFDITSFDTNKISAFPVPNAYNATDCSLTLTALPAGQYLFMYSFKCHFGTKSKPVNWQITGTYGNAVDDFSMDNDANEIGNKKNQTYFFPKEWAGGDLTFGIRFKDQNASGDIVIDFADVIVFRVG